MRLKMERHIFGQIRFQNNSQLIRNHFVPGKRILQGEFNQTQKETPPDKVRGR